MRRMLLVLSVLAAAAAAAQAAPHVEADPNNQYPITPEVGPWMICVHYYTGPNARDMAHELTLLIRSRDNLPAFVFNHGGEEKRKQDEYAQQMRKLCADVHDLRLRRVKIEEQYAVLIGGYPDMDTARQALDTVKKLKPPESEKLMDRVTTMSRVDEKKAMVQGAFVNPFVTSFVVPNPTVPRQPVERPKFDPAWKELNTGRPYNLLDLKDPWTMVVKDFPGLSVVQPRTASDTVLNMFGFGNKAEEVLSANAKQAEEVARVLRQMKFDAYVLHTRTDSIVTVGGYASNDDPRLQQLQKQLANLKLGPIQCMAQPMPMPVPRP